MRVGVIGTGSMGQNHARVYSEIAELVGVADINAEVGRAIAKRFGTTYFRDFRDLLNSGVEAVTVATPTKMHYKVARVAIENGVHVLVEKPLAANLREAKALVGAAERRGVTLAAGHIERHNPAVQFTQNAMNNGGFGTPICLTAKRVSNFPSRIKDVGVIMDLGIHDIDVARYLASGEVTSVYATGGRHRHDRFEDYANILLEFDNGITAHIEVNWLTPMKVRELFITCEEGYIYVDYISQSVSVSTQKPPKDIDTADLYNVPWELNKREYSLKRQEPLKNELLDFIHGVKDGKEPLVTGQDGYAVLKIALSAVKSFKKKCRVKVDI